MLRYNKMQKIEMYKTVTYNLAKPLKILAVAGLLFMFSLFFLGPKHASAITSNFPRGTSNGDEWVLLSQYQCPGHCLQTPKADIRIFYNDKQLDMDGVAQNDPLRVDVQSLCRYNGTPDGNAFIVGGTSKPGWPGITCTGLNTNTGNAISTFSILRSNLTCNTPKYPGWCYADLTVSVAPNPGNQPILGVYIFPVDNVGNIKITAQEDNNPGVNYTNTDCYTGAGGTCSPSGGPPAGNSNVIALWNNYNNNGPDTHSNWSMTFKPDCTLNAPKQSYIRWYDADDGGSGNNGTQSGQISFDLYDQTAGTYIFNNKINLGGNDSYRDAAFTVTPGHSYKWTWNNVSATNGIQIWMPYSEIGALVDCGIQPKVPNAQCSPASKTISGLALNKQVQYGVNFLNNGNVDWTAGATPPYGWFTTVDNNPPNAPNPINQDVSVGETYATGNFTFTAPGTYSTTKIITFQMTKGANNAFGTKCTLILKTGAPVPIGGGSIEATCEETTVRVSGITATYHPNGGAATQITNVPVVIKVIDNADNTRTFSYPVPGGVPNNPLFPKKIPTFDIWNGMWPHGSYTLQIFVQGANGSPDSLGYKNDGSWFQPGGDMNGPFWYPNNINGYNTDVVQQCLQASCRGGTAADAEPGQSVTSNFTIHFENDAGRKTPWPSNDGGGYNFTAAGNGGVTVTSANPQNNTSGPINAWTAANGDGNPVGTDVVVTIAMRVDYKGSYTVSLRFQNNDLNLDPGPTVNCPGPETTPSTKPFFSVTGGDLATGGGFSKVSDTPLCTLGDPGYISPATGSGYDAWSGGIRAYGNEGAKKGSSAQFGVLSLGYNIGSPDGPTGLYSKDSAVFADRNQPGVGGMGGLLNETGYNVNGWHCVNDFFTKTQKSSSPAITSRLPGNINIDNDLVAPAAGSRSATGQYLVNGDVTLTSNGCNSPAGNIPENTQITLYVNGNVDIVNDICYTSSWTSSFDRLNIPYFSLIVKGNIIVHSTVTELDGLYVAQPRDKTDGIFATCEAGGFCNKQLTVNGAVLAQSVELKRERGTVGPLELDKNGIGDGEPAEIFNYTPSMTLGVPNFSSKYVSAESIFSLPPVF